MFISKKKFEEIKAQADRVPELEEQLKFKESYDRIIDIIELQQNKIRKIYAADGVTISNSFLNLSDNIPVYVDDYFGGKVFKQESVKVIVIDKEGNVTYSQTKQSNKTKDFQRNYIIVEKE